MERTEKKIMKNPPTLTLAGFIIAFVGAIMFSTKAIIVKLAFADAKVDALTLLTIRMLFSLPFYLIAAFLISSKAGNVWMNKKQVVATMVLGLFGYYLSSLFDFMGLQYISAGLERLILFLYPTFAVLIATFVFKQAMHRNQMIALILTYIGIGIAFYGEMRLDTGNPEFYWGSFLVFLCALTYGAYIAGSGKLIPNVGAAKFTAYAMLSSTAGVFLHYLLGGQHNALAQSVALWKYGVVLALVATVIPTFMLSYALKRIGTNNVAVISSIGPVSTIMQAHYFLGEPVFTEQLVGTAFVVFGILLLSWQPKKIV
jgi:drug/metabolite transporter (DMT)-like permease